MTTSTTENEDQPELQLATKPPRPPKVKAASQDERDRIAGHASAFTVPFGALRIADNIRADDTDVVDLAESIRRHGLISPITVRPHGIDEDHQPIFVVETGHRRYHALRALKVKGDDPVPVHVVNPAGLQERTARQWVENMQREQLTPIDEANTIRTLTQLHGMRIQDAADLLGVDRNTASRRLLLLQLPETAQDKVAEGTFEIEAAQLLGRLIRDGVNPEVTNLLIGAPRDAVQRAVDTHRKQTEQDRLTAQLEARGFVVLSDPRNGPAPVGYRTEMAADLGIATKAEVTAVDIDQVETVRDDEGRPVVWVTRSRMDDKLHTYSVTLRELFQPTPSAGDDGGPPALTFGQQELARNTIKAVRTKQLLGVLDGPNAPAPSDESIRRAVMHLLVSRSHTVGLVDLAEHVGIEVVMLSPDRVDVEATAKAWHSDLTIEQVDQVTMVLTLLLGVFHLRHLDQLEDQDLDGSPLAAMLVDSYGVTKPLSPVEFRTVALRAAEKIEEGSQE